MRTLVPLYLLLEIAFTGIFGFTIFQGGDHLPALSTLLIMRFVISWYMSLFIVFS